MRQRVAAEQARLDLRNIEAAHAEMDRKARTAAQERKRDAKRRIEAAQAVERERQESLKRAEDERRAREQHEREQEERETLRRETIQDVKRRVIDWWSSGLSCESELKSQVLQAVERRLANLPVEDLPESELITIATGIREAFFQQAKSIEDAEKQDEAARQRLIEHGQRYAERELRAVDGLDLSERWRIEGLVKSELETVEGDESLADVEDLVESILDDEGIGLDEDDE